jgi:hypothetical protein
MGLRTSGFLARSGVRSIDRLLDGEVTGLARLTRLAQLFHRCQRPRPSGCIVALLGQIPLADGEDHVAISGAAGCSAQEGFTSLYGVGRCDLTMGTCQADKGLCS